MGGAVSTGSDNSDLIDNLVDANYIKSPEIERVFRAVDRAEYYLKDHRESAYKDLAWKHGHLHMSAPCIYSEVMESLLLQPGLSFLNLGSGTGYLSTMIGLILGPYGVNHGIEIYEDVVDYAKERLEHFKKTSVNFDDFDLCEPQFIKGNCLQLTPGQQYERVYCGAACPIEHENYMKNLITINGILVMPLNDQLQQIRRTGETTWEVKNVLPVSFASLIIPGQETSSETFEPPDVNFLPLKAACRLCIRKAIRTNIHFDHPELSKVTKQKKKKSVKPRSKRRINIVPMSMGMMILRQFDSDESDDPDGPLSHLRNFRWTPNQVPEEDDQEDQSVNSAEEEDDEIDSDVSDIASDTREKRKTGENDRDNQNGNYSKNIDEGHQDSCNRRECACYLPWKYPSDCIDKSENQQLSDSKKETPNECTNNLYVNENKPCSKNGILSKNRHSKAKNDSRSISTDESDEDNMGIDLFNRNTCKVRSLSPSRKIRYSSNTSADTSETSGIGSLGEDPSELESCHSSEKPSPGSSVGDDGMDCTEHEVLIPKVNICSYMKERVNELPVPSTLKSYMLYYRQ